MKDIKKNPRSKTIAFIYVLVFISTLIHFKDYGAFSPHLLYCSKKLTGHLFHNVLAILAAHLAASPHSDLSSPPIIEPWCVSAQTAASLGGSLTIIDERTRKKYHVPVSAEGTVKAVDLKKITTGKDDKGLKVYDPGYLNTAPMGNKGAFIRFEAPDLKPNIVTFSAVLSTFAFLILMSSQWHMQTTFFGCSNNLHICLE
ncbi:hypothetical protein SLEP1_g56366 [Rubroshorea leprosula]|uniref:Uncharacterized protein n=1 Tax=Rubroshorea leprosula TaxID=152421 RepID=A0AAV5MIK2_9ROSI|nr:hypothetical protein SLEP1_g56366 [Rubroshorea leprosula]